MNTSLVSEKRYPNGTVIEILGEGFYSVTGCIDRKWFHSDDALSGYALQLKFIKKSINTNKGE
jgi:hypothetical protein